MTFVSDSASLTTGDAERRLELKWEGQNPDQYQRFVFISPTHEVRFSAVTLPDDAALIWSVNSIDSILRDQRPEWRSAIRAHISDALTSFRLFYGLGPSLPVQVRF